MSQPTPAPDAPEGTSIPPAMRDRWYQYVKHYCLFYAALLNLAKHDEERLSAIPEPAYRVAFELCTDLTKRACLAEVRRGETMTATAMNSLRQKVVAELWNSLKPFARRGDYEIDHLSAAPPLNEDRL